MRQATAEAEVQATANAQATADADATAAAQATADYHATVETEVQATATAIAGDRMALVEEVRSGSPFVSAREGTLSLDDNGQPAVMPMGATTLYA